MRNRTRPIVSILATCAIMLTARTGFAAMPVAHTVSDLCGVSGDCAVTKKFAITDNPAVFDLGARNFHVTASGGMIGNGNEIDVITAGTVSIDKGALVTSLRKGGNGGTIKITGPMDTHTGFCSILGKIQANAVKSSGVGGNGGSVSFSCEGAHLGPNSVVEAKGALGQGGVILLDGDDGAISIDKGAKADASGSGADAGEIEIVTTGTCGTASAPIIPKLLANTAVVGDSGGEGGYVGVLCDGGISLGANTSVQASGAASSTDSGAGGSLELQAAEGPLNAVKGAKLLAQSKGDQGGSVSITALGPCVPLALTILTNGKPNADGGGDGGQVTVECHGPLTLPKGAKIQAGSTKTAAAGEVALHAWGQCAGDQSFCSSDADCGGAGTCDNIGGGHCSVTTNQACSDTSDCPLGTCLSGQCTSDNSPCTMDGDCTATEPCVGASGACNGLAIPCQADSDCQTCQVPGVCDDGTQCVMASDCAHPLGGCSTPQHCSTTTSQTCSVNADCPDTQTCVPQLQIDTGAVVLNDGGEPDPLVVAVDLNAIGPCVANGTFQSDAKGSFDLGPGAVFGGLVNVECGGVTLGSKAKVETICTGDAAGGLFVDTTTDAVAAAAACDIGGTITAKSAAISDKLNGVQAGAGGDVEIACGTTLKMSAKVEVSGGGGDGLNQGNDTNAGQVLLIAGDTIDVSGKVTAKSAKGAGGTIGIFGHGVTTTAASVLEVTGNVPGELPDGFAGNIDLTALDGDDLISGSVTVGGSLLAKGSGSTKQAGAISVEACGVALGSKGKLVSDGVTAGTNTLTAHQQLTLDPKAKLSAMKNGVNSLIYGQGSAPATSNVKPATTPSHQMFSGDNCP